MIEADIAPAIHRMRIHQFSIIFGFFLFEFVSLSSVTAREEFGELTYKSTNKVMFSLFSGRYPASCSICRSDLVGETDMIRDRCGHGYHATCLQSCFVNARPVTQHRFCQDCHENDHYSLFLSFILFDAPELPDGITYIPELLDDEHRLRFWVNVLKRNNPIALKRALKIGMTTKIIKSPNGYADLSFIAANRATPENLQILLESGVSISSNEKYSLARGLEFAMKVSNFPNAAVFLNFGANVDQLCSSSKMARTLLSAEIVKENVEKVKFLIENNADVNLAAAGDDSPLHLAVLKDNYTIVDLLMKTKEVDMKTMNKQKRSPIYSAALLGKLNALRAILDNKPPGFDYYNMDGFSLLQYTIFMGPIESVKFLIERGFKPISRDGSITYALHLAINTGKVDTVKFLLECGADPYETMSPTIFDHFQKSIGPRANRIAASDPPIMSAIFQRNLKAVEILLDAGTNPNTRIFGSFCSILHLACSIGHVEIASFLISRGADIHNLDSNQKTPFHYNSPEFYNKVVKDF